VCQASRESARGCVKLGESNGHHRGHRQSSSDHGQQRLQRERFANEGLGAAVRQGVSTHEDDRDRWGVGCQGRGQADAIPVRHLHIGEDQIRYPLGDLPQGDEAVAGLLDGIARGPQEFYQGVPHTGIVIDNEDGRGIAHRPRAAGSRMAGVALSGRCASWSAGAERCVPTMHDRAAHLV
jgi:hypothetical protein